MQSTAEDEGGGAKLCPSARCRPGALLLGIVGEHGSVDFLSDRITVTQRFAEVARTGRTPEARFRFSSPCLRAGCSKWTGDGCGVADQAARLVPPDAAGAKNPGERCPIRSDCRWIAEQGPTVCRTCRWIVTERHGPG